MKTKCKNIPMFRYTWAGSDESYCCLDHAMQIKTVSDAMGYYVQLIPLSADEQSKQNCHNEVEENET